MPESSHADPTRGNADPSSATDGGPHTPTQAASCIGSALVIFASIELQQRSDALLSVMLHVLHLGIVLGQRHPEYAAALASVSPSGSAVPHSTDLMVEHHPIASVAVS